jgi:hypothetical protein
MTDKEHKCVDRNELLDKTKLNIQKFGLHVIMVSSESYNPTFAYSVGLTETYNHPEIICFRLPSDLSHQIINDIAEIIKQTGAIKTDKEYDNIFKDSRAVFLKVHKRNIDDYFGVALEYYKDKVFDAYNSFGQTEMTNFRGKRILRKSLSTNNLFWTEMQTSNSESQRT